MQLDLWVKVEDGVVTSQPNNLPAQVRSWGASQEALIKSGWYPVVSVKPETIDYKTETWESQTFEIKEDHVIWTLVKRYKTQKEIDDETNERWKLWRIERNFRLAETDWMVIKCAEKGESIPNEWAVYRQALRDLPINLNFNGVDWPVKPS